MIQLDNCVAYFNKLILDELGRACITWVAGGCVRDYFSIGYLSSDVDLFFPDEHNFNECRKYLMEITEYETVREEEGITIIEKKTKPLAGKLFENDNVLKVKYKGRVYDVIKKYFPSCQETIKQFDFTVCCAGVDNRQVYTHQTFFIDLAKRQLMINELPFPLSTLWRLQKYIKKGYTICSGETMKLGKAIGALQTNTPEGEAKAIELNTMSEGGIRFTTFD
jgi:hypothetical protein